MRIALYADVHGNLPALQAFMKDSCNKGVQCFQFLGDAVNYGGKPQECIDEIIKLGMIGHIDGIDINTSPATIDRQEIQDLYNGKLQGKFILGNNDAACCGLEDPDYFTGCAKDSANITKNTLLSEWHKDFLRNRPMEAPMNIYNEEVGEDDENKIIRLRFNHSAPGNLSLGVWHYIKPDTNLEHMEQYFDFFKERIFVVAHSHLPCAFVSVNNQSFPVTFPLPTKNYDKAIINAGSIGQPRFGETRGSYIILDSVLKTIDLEWFTYDIQTAMNDIFDATLPEQNAQRLLRGRVIKKFNNTDSGPIHV
jgi:predicted phosphodiesterase